MVVGFAGVLIQQILKYQKSVWDIVKEKDSTIKSKDAQLDQKDKVIHARDLMINYLQWERESARFRAGERASDPGPYVSMEESGA